MREHTLSHTRRCVLYVIMICPQLWFTFNWRQKNGTLVNTVINIWREKDIRIFIWICAAELFFCLFSWPGSSGVHLLISALRRRFLVQIAFLVKILTFCISYSVSEGKERNEIKSKQKGRRENHNFIDFPQHYLHRIYNLSFLMVFQKQPQNCILKVTV